MPGVTPFSDQANRNWAGISKTAHTFMEPLVTSILSILVRKIK